MRAILQSLLDHHQTKYENDETKSSTYDLKNNRRGSQAINFV